MPPAIIAAVIGVVGSIVGGLASKKTTDVRSKEQKAVAGNLESYFTDNPLDGYQSNFSPLDIGSGIQQYKPGGGAAQNIDFNPGLALGGGGMGSPSPLGNVASSNPFSLMNQRKA